MEIQGLEISNIPGMGKNQKSDVEIGVFLEILNPLIESEEIDVELVDLDLKLGEGDEEENTEDLAVMLNMPWIGIREIKTSIPQEKDMIVLEGTKELSQGETYIDEGNRQLFSEDMDEIQDSPINSLDKESMKGFKEMESLFHENKDVSMKDEGFLIEDTSQDEALDFVEKVNLEVKEEIPKKLAEEVIEDKFPIKEKTIDSKDNQWTSISPMEIQKNTVELNKDINFQDQSIITENIERVSESIIKLMEVNTQGDTQVMKVKLYPEDLGNVDITLRMEEGKLVANILVDNESAKQLFINNIQELNQNLVKQNIHIGDMNVDLSNSSQGNSEQNGKNPFKPNKNFNINSGTLSTSSGHETILHPQGVSILA